VNSPDNIERGALDEDEEEEGVDAALLFVGDIPKDCTESDLYNIFSRCGAVTSARVQRSKTTSKPLGYAFVQMATREEALSCIDSLNGELLRTRQIKVSRARRNHTLLVFNISLDVNKEDLMRRFDAFGEVQWSCSTYEKLGNIYAKLHRSCATNSFLVIKDQMNM
jgi:RNA recognition motif-containing protein